MDELRRNVLPQTASARRAGRAPERSNRLGQTLLEARLDKGLELRDLSEITSVRLSHLEALESGRHRDLPEEVYSKNFVRLYAQAVGLDPARMLLLYAQERRGAAPPAVREVALTGLELPPEPATSPFDNPKLGRVLSMLTPFLLVVGAVLLALWAFNGLLWPAAPRPVQTRTVPAEPVRADTVPSAAAVPPATPAAETPLPAPTPTMILLSLRTTPPGAEISIDGYRFGQSPIVDAPVRSGRRTVRVERGGYRTFERTLDLSVNRRLSVELVATGRQGAATLTGAGGQTRAQTPPRIRTRDVIPARVTIRVTAEAWLEVYRGSARGEGERLVYETAQPGDTFTFDAPVYIFSGNAGGVSVARGDRTAELLGATGAVVGAPY